MADSLNILGGAFPPVDEAHWRAQAEKALKGRSVDDALRQKARDGFSFSALEFEDYASSRLAGKGEAAGWRIMQPVTHPIPVEANRLALNDLEGGVHGLHIVINPVSWSSAVDFDPMAGVVVRNDADLDALLGGVYLDMIPISFDAGPAAHAIKALFENYAVAKGHDLSALGVTYGADPYSVRASFGPFAPYQLDQGLDEAVADGVDFTLSSRCWHDAGASEAQELSILITAGLGVLRKLEAAGMALVDAQKRIRFSMPCDADVFFTMSKFRALRQLWGRVLMDCGVYEPDIHIKAETSFRMLSVRDPWVNILRSTSAAFGAVCGGADDISVHSYTDALGLGGDGARRIARNVQIILADESFMGAVSDPAGGAFSMEALTNALAKDAWDGVRNIEEAGGLTPLVEGGTLLGEVDRMWTAREEGIQKCTEALTGVNAFANLTEVLPSTLNVGAPDDHGERLDVMEAVGDGPEPLPIHRLGESFEYLRDLSDRYMIANGARPKVFMAQLGTVAQYTARATFAKNFVMSGGLSVSPFVYEGDGDALLKAFSESGAKVVIMAGVDEHYCDNAPLITQLRDAGATCVCLVARPSDAMIDLAVDDLIYAGVDAYGTLSRLMMFAGALK